VTRRRLVPVVTGLALAGSLLVAGCSTPNTATVTSTPSPASTDPFETPTPRVSVTATASTTSTPTASPARSPSPSPTSTPTVLAKPVSTHALVRGIGTKGSSRFTITYDPVVLCTKAGVDANEAPKECKKKPAKTDADGSWTVRTTTSSVIVTLSAAVSGTLYPAGVSFDVTTKNLAKQKALNGVVFDWSTITVPALLTVEKNEIKTVTGSRPGN
jgi:outer membrane murein-binding lipoprotein Lpp